MQHRPAHLFIGEHGECSIDLQENKQVTHFLPDTKTQKKKETQTQKHNRERERVCVYIFYEALYTLDLYNIYTQGNTCHIRPLATHEARRTTP